MKNCLQSSIYLFVWFSQRIAVSVNQVIEEQLKGLPDVKGTKYMEMGRHQMEVGALEISFLPTPRNKLI